MSLDTVSTEVIEANNETQEAMTAEQALYPGESEKKADDVVANKTEEVSTAKENNSESESEETDQQETETQKEEWDYKLETSEDSLLDNSVIEGLEAIAKENNWSKDEAMKVLELQEKLANDWIKEKVDAYEAERNGWRETVINDKELGGENLAKTSETCRKVVKKFASDNFITMLQETGYGDHPEFVKFVWNIGKLMDNDSLILPKVAGEEKSFEDYFYSNTAN